MPITGPLQGMKSLEGLFRHLEEHEREQAEAKAKAKIEAQAQAKVVVEIHDVKRDNHFGDGLTRLIEKSLERMEATIIVFRTEGEKKRKTFKIEDIKKCDEYENFIDRQ